MAELSEEENDIDIYSDDEDDINTSIAYMSETEKKAHHNALERKRRDQIKDSFLKLRDVIPKTKNEKISRAIILKRAINYIRFKSEKNRRGSREVQEIKRRMQMLKRHKETAGSQHQHNESFLFSDHYDASNLDNTFYNNNNNSNCYNGMINNDDDDEYDDDDDDYEDDYDDEDEGVNVNVDGDSFKYERELDNDKSNTNDNKKDEDVEGLI